MFKKEGNEVTKHFKNKSGCRDDNVKSNQTKQR